MCIRDSLPPAAALTALAAMAFSLSSTFEELPLTASHSKDPWVDLRLYGRRLLKPSSLDVEYVLWQMLQLCVEPKRVYRTTTFHSRVKHQWARDDPAFVVVLAYMLAVAGVAWCLAFGQGALETLSLLLYVLLFDFVALGSAIASAGLSLIHI